MSLSLSLSRITVLAALIGLPVAFPLAAAPAAKGAKPPAVVEVAAVQRAALTESLSAVGTLRAGEAVVLKPEIAGRVSRIHFREGQAVRAGALLVSLDDRLIAAQLAQAAAAARQSQADYERARELAAQKLVATADLERARTQVDVDRAKVREVEARLRQSRILAPFAGVTGLRQFSPGDMVQAGQALVALVSVHPIKVDARFPEAQAVQLRAGQTVQVTLNALPGETFTGRVLALEPVLEAASRAQTVRAELPNPAGRLRPGMTAQVAVVLAQSQAVLVPEQALVPQGQKVGVYVVNGKEALFRPVVTGARRPGQVEIKQGLAVGETIVVSGQNKLFGPKAAIMPVPAGSSPGLTAAGPRRN